jgi:hypothetical protein
MQACRKLTKQRSRVEPQVRIGNAERIIDEAGIEQGVRDDKHLFLQDGVSANRGSERRFPDTQSDFRFEPLTVFVNEVYDCNRCLADERRQSGDMVVGVFFRRVEDVIR